MWMEREELGAVSLANPHSGHAVPVLQRGGKILCLSERFTCSTKVTRRTQVKAALTLSLTGGTIYTHLKP